MVLSPQDIHNKEFSVKMRGYNIDQVNDFLDQIIKDYQITIKQNDDLRAALNDTQAKLKHFNDLQNSLNQSILVAQQAADQVKNSANGEAQVVVNNANQQANNIINDANQRANQIIYEATQQANSLNSEISTLKQSTKSFREKILHLLQGQLDFIQSSNWDDVLNTGQDKSINDLLHNLDNSQSKSVESNQDSNMVSGPSQFGDPTVVYYPDGSSR